MIKEKRIKKILEKQKILIKPSKDVLNKIENIYSEFSFKLRKKLRKKKIKAEVFLGGSLAKKTIVKKEIFDTDIFVRFDKKYSEISKLLGKILGKKADRIKGSRDYYQLKEQGILIETIPVLKIKKPEEAENVTDLSYFHVNYIVNKIKKNKKLIDEIRLAKNFAYAQNCYGAESYIQGFSGYSLELLICHFGSFLNFIKEVCNVGKKKLIIDDANFYKGEGKVLIELNEAKRQSPIILIDPTFKERNALSSLSKKTFYKFQNLCREFLKSPSTEFFTKKEISKEFEKNKNIKTIIVRTNKQAGNISGTKSRKFFDFFIFKLKKEFIIRKSGFEYNESMNESYFYFVLKKKKDEIIKGPPITSFKNLRGFKKVHKNMFIKNGFAYAKIKHDLSFDEWFKKFLKKERKVIKEMGIDGVDKN